MSTPAELMNVPGFLPEVTELTPSQRFGMDARLYVQFHVMPVMNEYKSKEAERIVYEDQIFVRIMVPGDKHSIVDRLATREDKGRFAKQLEAFNQGRSQESQGTPLSVMPWLTPSQVEEYKYFNIYTVEQLAEVADATGQKFLLFPEHKKRAREFMSGIVSDSVRAELDTRDAKISELEAKLEAFMASQVGEEEEEEEDLEA